VWAYSLFRASHPRGQRGSRGEVGHRESQPSRTSPPTRTLAGSVARRGETGAASPLAGAHNTGQDTPFKARGSNGEAKGKWRRGPRPHRAPGLPGEAPGKQRGTSPLAHGPARQLPRWTGQNRPSRYRQAGFGPRPGPPKRRNRGSSGEVPGKRSAADSSGHLPHCGWGETCGVQGEVRGGWPRCFHCPPDDVVVDRRPRLSFSGSGTSEQRWVQSD
jgi:hypothetical protein